MREQNNKIIKNGSILHDMYYRRATTKSNLFIYSFTENRFIKKNTTYFHIFYDQNIRTILWLHLIPQIAYHTIA